MRSRLLYVALAIAVGWGLACGGDASPAATHRRGEVVLTERLYGVTRLEIAAGLIAFGESPLHARSGVDVYRVVYRTVDAHGEPTEASGALFVPTDSEGPLPIVSYQHGTILTDAEAPSRGGAENAVGLAFAGDRYLAVMPDYLGFGDSPDFHPFVQAAPAATAVVDMLRAVRTLPGDLEVELSGEIFLLGYSEGGYATMAAHRAVEAEYANELKVTASAPMAGPYDLSGAFAKLFSSGSEYPEPAFLPYVILAYDDTYDLFDDVSMVFMPDLAFIPSLFDRATAASEIDPQLPSVPREMLSPDVLAAFESDPRDPLRLRLAENDVYDWVPEAPVRLYHCAADRLVPFANSRTAIEYFRSGGAQSVALVDPNPAAGHTECAVPSILLAKQWFDSFREGG